MNRLETHTLSEPVVFDEEQMNIAAGGAGRG